jgi:hypothetical protein
MKGTMEKGSIPHSYFQPIVSVAFKRTGADDSAILASFLLDEKLGRLGVCGCACCIVRLHHEQLPR